MTTGDIKRSFCLGAVGQVGGLAGGFISVVIISVISPRNFFDSPIRIAVFISACGLIGGIAALSASISLAVSEKLVLSIPLALGASTCLCAVLKLILSPAGEDSPIGKLFALVSIVFTLCQVLAGWKARTRVTNKQAKAPEGQVLPRPSLGPILTAAIRTGAGTALAILGVLMIAYAGIPIFDVSQIDRWGIALYVLLGFIVGAVIPLGERICARTRPLTRSLETR